VVGTQANLARPDVNQAVSITGQHGFAYPVPERFRDGKTHIARAFGIDSSGNASMNSLIGEKTFTATVLPSSSPSPTLSPSPSVSVSPVSTTSPVARKAGDVDDNGKVDIFDYNAVVSHFGQKGSNLAGDGDSDGDVDIFDYNIVVSNFGK
jgi:hypothetical protein